LRKALDVTLHGLIEPPGAHAIDQGQIAIEDHTLPAQDQDRAADLLDRHWRRAFCRNALFCHKGL
jgi:hypothetical protein